MEEGGRREEEVIRVERQRSAQLPWAARVPKNFNPGRKKKNILYASVCLENSASHPLCTAAVCSHTSTFTQSNQTETDSVFSRVPDQLPLSLSTVHPQVAQAGQQQVRAGNPEPLCSRAEVAGVIAGRKWPHPECMARPDMQHQFLSFSLPLAFFHCGTAESVFTIFASLLFLLQPKYFCRICTTIHVKQHSCCDFCYF